MKCRVLSPRRMRWQRVWCFMLLMQHYALRSIHGLEGLIHPFQAMWVAMISAAAGAVRSQWSEDPPPEWGPAAAHTCLPFGSSGLNVIAYFNRQVMPVAAGHAVPRVPHPHASLLPQRAAPVRRLHSRTAGRSSYPTAVDFWRFIAGTAT